MLFNSWIYLLVFLPLATLGYVQLRQRSAAASLWWLNLCSFFFYGWWNPAYIPLLLLSISGNFLLGQQLSRSHSRKLLALGIGINLGLLAYFKYTGFVLANFNAMVGTRFHDPGIILPLAISFFTFNQIAFLVDARDGLADEYRFSHYCLFVSFFPHLLAGPIVHHRELMPQFESIGKKPMPWAAAISIISFGLFKKTVIAHFVGDYADQVFDGKGNPLAMAATDYWIGTLAFNLQIYFDFSAYCDIAYGSALLFGITLPQNFLSPYKSPGIIEFWKRWHMTLGRFITSYIYTPLLRSKLGRISFGKAMGVTVITMALVGLWHGAGWNYIVFGLAHGIMLVINHLWRKTPFSLSLLKVPGYHVLCVLLTFFCVTTVEMLYRVHDISTAFTMYRAMFDVQQLHGTTHLVQPQIDSLITHPGWSLTPLQKILPVFALLLAWVWFMPNLQQVMRDQPYALCSLPQTPSRLRWQANGFWALLTAFCLIVGLIGINDTSTFIYFQF
jgi:D-alanyl-lipoteichoic acid acyltransferase DltB (MBOAT superfamily)